MFSYRRERYFYRAPHGSVENRHVFLLFNGDRVTCNSCRESFTVKDPAFQPWLAGQCFPIPCTDRPMPISGLIHVGNRYAHYTHKLKIHKGFVYCAKCGSRATDQMRLLSRPCRPPRSYGKATIRAILSDRLPPGLTNWPER